MRYFTLLSAFVLAGCSQPVASPKPAPVKAAAPQMSREHFDKLVIGKTTKQVIAVVGRPERTSKSDAEHEIWDYKNIAVDKVTGKSGNTHIHFTEGVATTVSHF